ncbi:MAG: hypothetical protein A2176_05225 [Spirochaetes bacterium RBG_13_51_14]|nr:MAG: hypothetical protein A2176_05225 [Spirochaetes bacterium RBG_13_51_14]
MSFIISTIITSAHAQSYKFDYHPAYGPAPLGSNPQSIARLLSYENFRSIKLLNAAIMNYGGGDAELDKLIDQYAEASALYFQNKMMESAKAFKENQAAITATAKQLAQKYHQETNALLKDSINMSIRAKLKLQLKTGQNQLVSDKQLGQAQAGVLKANDYYDRFKDAKSVDAISLITAIYYYRGAKQNMFTMMKVVADSQSKALAEEEVKAMIAKKQLPRSRKEETRRDLENQKRKELESKYLDKYAKDITDNNNQVYQSKEKEK